MSPFSLSLATSSAICEVIAEPSGSNKLLRILSCASTLLGTDWLMMVRRENGETTVLIDTLRTDGVIPVEQIIALIETIVRTKNPEFGASLGSLIGVALEEPKGMYLIAELRRVIPAVRQRATIHLPTVAILLRDVLRARKAIAPTSFP